MRAAALCAVLGALLLCSCSPAPAQSDEAWAAQILAKEAVARQELAALRSAARRGGPNPDDVPIDSSEVLRLAPPRSLDRWAYLGNSDPGPEQRRLSHRIAAEDITQNYPELVANQRFDEVRAGLYLRRMRALGAYRERHPDEPAVHLVDAPRYPALVRRDDLYSGASVRSGKMSRALRALEHALEAQAEAQRAATAAAIASIDAARPSLEAACAIAPRATDLPPVRDISVVRDVRAEAARAIDYQTSANRDVQIPANDAELSVVLVLSEDEQSVGFYNGACYMGASEFEADVCLIDWPERRPVARVGFSSKPPAEGECYWLRAAPQRDWDAYIARWRSIPVPPSQR